jgi:hypothetical protein
MNAAVFILLLLSHIIVAMVATQCLHICERADYVIRVTRVVGAFVILFWLVAILMWGWFNGLIAMLAINIITTMLQDKDWRCAKQLAHRLYSSR